MASGVRPRPEASRAPAADAPAVTAAPVPKPRDFALVAGLALVVRALYLVQVREAPLFSLLIMDGASYEAWARRIAEGDWLGAEVFYQAPLYPYLLAVVKLVAGDGLWPIRILQALLGAMSCGLLMLAGRAFFSRRVGIGAGIALALYPPAIFFDGQIQKASLGGVLVTALLWLLGRVRRSPRPREWLACGVALGALMATREETLLLVPALLAWCALHFRDRPLAVRARWSAAFVGGLALVLAPIAARNAVVGGEFVLTTSQAGPNFFIGNHRGASGVYEPLRPGRGATALERIDARELAEMGAGRELSPTEVSAWWFKCSFDWIASEPLAWLKLLGRKLALTLNAYEIPDYEDQQYFAEHSSLLRWLGFVLNFGVAVSLGAAGVLLTWRRRRELDVLYAVMATFALGCVLFYVFGRYRYPLAPLAILFASAAVAQSHELYVERAHRKLAKAALLVVVFAVASNVPLIDARAQLAMSYANAGAALFEAGRYEDAAAQSRRSLELDDDPDTRANLSAALVRTSRAQEAVEHAERALRTRTGDPILLRALGEARYAAGDEAGAIDAFKRSIQAYPRDPRSWEVLEEVFIRRGDWMRALETARSCLRYNPDDVGAALSLATMLATSADEARRDTDEALKIVRELEQRTAGRDFRVLDVLSVVLASRGEHDAAREAAMNAKRMAEEAGEN